MIVAVLPETDERQKVLGNSQAKGLGQTSADSKIRLGTGRGMRWAPSVLLRGCCSVELYGVQWGRSGSP